MLGCFLTQIMQIVPTSHLALSIKNCQVAKNTWRREETNPLGQSFFQFCLPVYHQFILLGHFIKRTSWFSQYMKFHLFWNPVNVAWHWKILFLINFFFYIFIVIFIIFILLFFELNLQKQHHVMLLTTL